MKSILSATLGALALAAVGSGAQAAPASGLAAAIDRDGASPVEQVTWWKYRRGCYWHHGYRHCGWGYRPYYRHYGYDWKYDRYHHRHRYW